MKTFFILILTLFTLTSCIMDGYERKVYSLETVERLQTESTEYLITTNNLTKKSYCTRGYSKYDVFIPLDYCLSIKEQILKKEVHTVDLNKK